MKIRTGLLPAFALLLAVSPFGRITPTPRNSTPQRERPEGRGTKIEWTNPHAYIYVSVKDASGKAVTWSLEGFPPNTLLRTGWHQNDLKNGDVSRSKGPRPETDQTSC